MNSHYPLLNDHETDSRGRILQAAYDLFVAHGFKAVSMQQIADAASITKATLYHHFLNKEALFSEVVLAAMEHMRGELGEIIASGVSPADQLIAFACRIFSRTQSDFGRLMTDMHENISIQQREKIMTMRALPMDMVEQIIASAEQTGDLPRVAPGLAASMFIGLVWGQIWTRKMEWIDGPLNEDLARAIVEIFFAGLRNAPQSVREFSVKTAAD
jgi:AcrR family transcriptional regulator